MKSSKQREGQARALPFCQSCGMPLSDDNDLGVNADGSANGDYCAYCYQNGAFTRDVTMEGMIDLCLPFLAGANRDKTEEQIRAALRQWFPSLKRWEGAARGE